MTWTCWKGLGWSEEKEQALCDARALRILTCPRGACRREKQCLGGADGCPSLREEPIRQEYDDIALPMLRRMLKERLDEERAGKEVAEAAKAARAAADERRMKLAFERARMALAHRRRGSGQRAAGRGR